jgi:hypothetical protein
MYTFSNELISDLHKDALGFRPLEAFYEGWTQSDDDKKQAIWDGLCREMCRREEEEKIAELAAEAKFEGRIVESIKMGAESREEAIRWILQAEGLDKEYDAGYICYSLGLPYSREAKFKQFVSWDNDPRNEENWK